WYIDGEPDAFHKSVPNEIASLNTVTPADNDVLVIEDASDGFAKKKVTVASLPSGGSGGFPNWQTYTPTWTGSSTNPSIGGGTLTGKYLQVGSTAFVVVEMVAGTGTNFGRSEERRVGKESGAGWWRQHERRQETGGDE